MTPPDTNGSATRRLVLASSSPYRRELLARLGVPFEVVAPRVDETEAPGEAPAALAARLAADKADSIDAADAVVIGCDQVASLHGRVLRKPGTHGAALQQLLACQNQVVDFATAAVVIDQAGGRRWQTVDHTRVAFAEHDEQALDNYLRREQAYDCAGGFKVEGLGIALFTKIESQDPTALIGLPMIWLAATLQAAGFDLLSPPDPR